MKRYFRKCKSRGVALAFALMTALLLMTLSTTVIGLSIRHARSGLESDFTQEALYAADWYTNAALDYMSMDKALTVTHDPDKPDSNFKGNPYDEVVKFNTGSGKPHPLHDDKVTATVKELSGTQCTEYGLTPDNPNNGYLLRFGNSADEPLVSFPTEPSRFAVSDIAVEKVEPTHEEYNTKSTPGYYHLVIHTRIYDESMRKTIEAIQSDPTKVGLSVYPTEGLLATRVVDVQARIESPLDYLHIIQDGRSWRAQGLNLDGGNNSLFENFLKSGNRQYLDNGLNICGFPEGYVENGKLRIDGGTRMNNEYIKKRNSGLSDVYIDGAANFFNTSSHKSKNGQLFAQFKDEFSQYYSGSDSFRYKTTPKDGIGTEIFAGGLNDNLKENGGSLGLPASGDNANYNADGSVNKKAYQERITYQKFARSKGKTLTVAVDDPTAVVVGQDERLNTKTFVPDIYSAGSESDVRPSFAKYVVTLGSRNGDGTTTGGTPDGNYITITKVNPAVPDNVQVIGSYDLRDPKSGITNGVLNIQGGNVEVQSAYSGGKPVEFKQELTIVADVEKTREDALNYTGAQSGTIAANKKNSIYSDVARDFFNSHPAQYFDLLQEQGVLTQDDRVMPPYTCQKLYNFAEKRLKDKNITNKEKAVLEAVISDEVIKTKKADRVIWPTPTSEAVEREGNVYLTSDIVCGTDGGKRGAVGIVAKNYIALNDKTAFVKNNKQSKKAADQKMSIEAMLFSFDKSVQFDWTNDACNDVCFEYNPKKYPKQKSYPETSWDYLKPSKDQKAINDKNKYYPANDREFNLIGCVVSSNLDIEGSEEQVGYLKQKELSNISLKDMPPYIPAYSEGQGRWVIISYKDTGVRNWF